MKENWKSLLISEGISLGVGGLSALATMGTMERYGILRQPPLSPPGWVFPVVWTGLFALMGVSAWRIWHKTSGKRRTKALILYGIQLAVNFAWPILFFRLGAYGPAFFWLLVFQMDLVMASVLLLALVALMIARFREIDKIAALLQIPYLLWLVFAGYLNAGIWLLNR